MIDYTDYLNVEHLPLTQYLKSNFTAIQRECDALLAAIDIAPKPKADSMGQHGKNREQVGKPMIEGDVYSCYLLLRPELLDDNEKEIVYAPERWKSRGWRRLQSPTLMAWMLRDDVLPTLGNVGFNRIYPGARINPHYGVSTDYFRMHLCIHGDPGAKFYLKGRDPYTWSDGNVMAFADGDMLHWVEHNGTGPRTILSIDVLKSELTK
jgi:hypothetical protein